MKKTKIVLLPILFCLTGCLSIEFNKNSHEEGLFGASGQINGNFSYGPYSGESFERSSYTASEITSKISTGTLEFNNAEDIKIFNSPEILPAETRKILQDLTHLLCVFYFLFT